jgi:hypothetical protein
MLPSSGLHVKQNRGPRSRRLRRHSCQSRFRWHNPDVELPGPWSSPNRSAAVCCLLAVLLGGAWGLTWVETSAADFGDGTPDNGLYASHRDGGAVEFGARFDLNNDGYIDLVCPDDSGPYLRVYFGSATGYDSANSRYYPISGGGGADMADLNTDGFPELIHSGWHSRVMTIYWGTDSGPSPTDTTQLATAGECEAVYAFDLDRDTYLDLICGTDTSTVTIFWGSAAGYSSSDTSIVALDGRIGQNLEIADFDQDGWADIAAVSWTRNANPVIYWGPGRRAREVVWLRTADGKSHGVTTADFDRDGWLDLVYTSYDNGTMAFIYYGSETGFSPLRRELVFPGQSFGGTVATYWDGDSALDLVFFRGEYRGSPNWVPTVYFNQPAESLHFNETHRANIGSTGFNASGGLIADFNRDGVKDVFIDGYRENDHSYVLWGPSWTSTTPLPSSKSHHGVAREVGGVYDRQFKESYVSSVFYAGDTARWRSVTWLDSTPGNSSIEMEVHTGNTPEPGPEWQEWRTFAKGDTIPVWWMSSHVQYRVTCRYDNPAVLPVLKEVRIEYDSVVILDVGVRTVLAPGGSVDSGRAVVPRVVVRNYGNKTVSFPVTMVIGGSYSQSVQQESLRSLVSDTVVFPAWTAEPVGAVDLTCFVALPRDTNHWNDTLRDTVVVLRPVRPDLGATAILAPPDTIDSGAVVAPSAVVRNFGTLPARFPVVMSIGSAYIDTVSDSLGPGQWDTVAFFNWTALAQGNHPITCYTNYAGDGDRSNDTVYGNVFVGPPVMHDIGVEQVGWDERREARGERRNGTDGEARAGDTLKPRALVRNYGVRTERFFDVRFRVGAAYSRVVNVGTALAPDSAVVVAFPDWVAVAGSYVMSCSTMLALDLDRTNDKETLSLAVARYSVMHIEPDQSDTIASDSQQAYRFYAEMESDSARVVDLGQSEVPPGWAAALYDSADATPLGGTLGLVQPGRRYWFSLRVNAPGPDLAGVLDTLSERFVITGTVRGDTTSRDSAALSLFLAPGLSIHNFPNPCFGSTRFIIGLPGPGAVTLALYDRAGARVRQLADKGAVRAGVLLLDWDGKNDAGKPVASGSYRYILDYSAGGTSTAIVKKLVLVRR